MKTINFELNRLDYCEHTVDGYKLSIGIAASEYKATISKTGLDGVSIAFYETKSFPTLSGASHWINKRFREVC